MYDKNGFLIDSFVYKVMKILEMIVYIGPIRSLKTLLNSDQLI